MALYFPYLNLAPAEMVALEELPERDKDALTPIFQLKRWLSSQKLEKAFGRIEKSFSTRRSFLLAPDASHADDEREISGELDAFLNPDDGFKAWCDLFEGRGANFIPSLQLTDAGQFDVQAQRLIGLGRGAMVALTRNAFQFLPAIAARTAANSDAGRGVTFLLDLGKQGRDILLQEAEMFGYCETILRSCHNAKITISASTFPDGFGSISNQEIYERLLFKALQRRLADALVYSDRGSARAEKQGGGSTTPYPRIDYPLWDEWKFYRTETSSAYKGGYKSLAEALKKRPDVWDPNLRLWGTQMIEKTALGDASGISSPARSTAVRINLHLHRQLWFDQRDRLYETDDDWTDD